MRKDLTHDLCLDFPHIFCGRLDEFNSSHALLDSLSPQSWEISSGWEPHIRWMASQLEKIMHARLHPTEWIQWFGEAGIAMWPDQSQRPEGARKMGLAYCDGFHFHRENMTPQEENDTRDAFISGYQTVRAVYPTGHLWTGDVEAYDEIMAVIREASLRCQRTCEMCGDTEAGHTVPFKLPLQLERDPKLGINTCWPCTGFITQYKASLMPLLSYRRNDSRDFFRAFCDLVDPSEGETELERLVGAGFDVIAWMKGCTPLPCQDRRTMRIETPPKMDLTKFHGRARFIVRRLVLANSPIDTMFPEFKCHDIDEAPV